MVHSKSERTCKLIKESTISKQIRLTLSSENSVVFRTNAGVFWQGNRVYSNEFRQYVLKDLRKVDGLPAGFSDLIVVADKGRIAFIETKTATGKARTAQLKFINRMQELGHSAGIARNIDDAIAILERSEADNSERA